VDSTGLLVTRPDGTTVDVPASVSGAGSVTFAQTAQLGVYRVETKTAPGASPSASPATSPSTSPGESSPPAGGAPGLGTPFASATPASNPSASASPGASPAPSPGTPEAERFFAVDLFDEGESNIAPGNGSGLEALGAPAVAGAAATGATRDELWFPLALLALLVLLVEWAVYERDGLVRLRRAVAGGRAPLRSTLLAAVGRGPGSARG